MEKGLLYMYHGKIVLTLLLINLSPGRCCLTKCSAAGMPLKTFNEAGRFYPARSFFVPQTNSCGVNAGYFPSRDTVITIGNDMMLVNNSINATSCEWYINGMVTSHEKNLLYHPSPGVNQIMLVASNGNCRDSIYSYVIWESIQPAEYSNFQKRYSPPGKSIEPYCMASDKLNGYLVAANYYTRSENNFVTKTTAFLHVNEKGCVDWSRSLAADQLQVIQSIIPTSDSGFLISAFPFQSQQDNYPIELNVFKLDKAGNKQWARSFSNGVTVTNYFSALCQTSDGGFALEMGSFPLSANPSFLSVIKIDPSGHFVWGRKLSVEDNAYYNIGGIVEKNNFIYASGSVYQGVAPFDVIRSFLVQIDRSSGQVIWTKRNDPAQGPLTFTGIHKYKDSMVLNSYSDKLVNDFMFLAGDGSYGSSVKVSNPYGSLNGKENIFVTQNNGIYFHQLSGVSGFANKEVVMLLDSNKQVSWQYDFPVPGLKTAGWYQLSPAPDNGVAGMGSGITADGFNALTFFKADAAGNGCNGGTTALQIVNNPVSFLPMTWTTNTSLSLHDSDIPMSLEDIPVESRLLCRGVMTGCDLLKLEGPRRVCEVGDTVIYRLHYDPSCGDAVSWTYDHQAIKVLSAAAAELVATFAKAGDFIIKVNKTGCNAAADSIVVTAGHNDIHGLPVDTTLCEGRSIKLDAGSIFSSYTWQDGSDKPSIDVAVPGIYWVRLTDNNGCVFTDSVIIAPPRAFPLAFLPADTVICSGEILDLTPVGSFQHYHWGNGDTSGTVIIKEPGSYTLQVTDQFGCTGSDTVKVEMRKCPLGIFFANAFTPNKDGVNDVFRPLMFRTPVLYQMIIYNRWGQMVFESADPKRGWDGRKGNKMQQSGIFMWVCTYQFPGEKKNAIKGSVLLLP